MSVRLLPGIRESSLHPGFHFTKGPFSLLLAQRASSILQHLGIFQRSLWEDLVEILRGFVRSCRRSYTVSLGASSCNLAKVLVKRSCGDPVHDFVQSCMTVLGSCDTLSKVLLLCKSSLQHPRLFRRVPPSQGYKSMNIKYVYSRIHILYILYSLY